ncbi:hypothetical protein LguiA_001940 [Lonicera macranthoides]
MAEEIQDQQNLESKRDECNSSVLNKLFEDFSSCFLLAHADDAITTIDEESDLVAAVDYSDEEEGVIPFERDEEIFEEDAVCEICFKAFKVNEDIVKMKCKCKNELVHEACAITSNCDVCEHQVEKIHLTLLQLPTDAWVDTHNGKKRPQPSGVSWNDSASGSWTWLQAYDHLKRASTKVDDRANGGIVGSVCHLKRVRY